MNQRQSYNISTKDDCDSVKSESCTSESSNDKTMNQRLMDEASGTKKSSFRQLESFKSELSSLVPHVIGSRTNLNSIAQELVSQTNKMSNLTLEKGKHCAKFEKVFSVSKVSKDRKTSFDSYYRDEESCYGQTQGNTMTGSKPVFYIQRIDRKTGEVKSSSNVPHFSWMDNEASSVAGCSAAYSYDLDTNKKLFRIIKNARKLAATEAEDRRTSLIVKYFKIDKVARKRKRVEPEFNPDLSRSAFKIPDFTSRPRICMNAFYTRLSELAQNSLASLPSAFKAKSELSKVMKSAQMLNSELKLSLMEKMKSTLMNVPTAKR